MWGEQGGGGGEKGCGWVGGLQSAANRHAIVDRNNLSGVT